jgi:hypothetical protein
MKTRILAMALTLLVNASLAAAQTVVLAAEDDWYPYSTKVGGEVQGRFATASEKFVKA